MKVYLSTGSVLILPIASTDYLGSVAYVGSFSKTVAPSLRLGFIVAPENLIQEVSYVSRYMDSHGNTALERAVGVLFQDGLIRRHLRKALKTYKERRDSFCQLLNDEVGDVIQFDIPEGGLAIWGNLSKEIPLERLIESCNKKGLWVPNESGFARLSVEFNAIRIGFASTTTEESKKIIAKLREGIQSI